MKEIKTEYEIEVERLGIEKKRAKYKKKKGAK
jgi:hypothetical protein